MAAWTVHDVHRLLMLGRVWQEVRVLLLPIHVAKMLGILLLLVIYGCLLIGIGHVDHTILVIDWT